MTILTLHLETDNPVPLAVKRSVNLRLLLKRRDLLEETFEEMNNSLVRARLAWNKRKEKRK